ncbi:MAG: hypothetical protein H6868_02160 [Rhodospirillales bacterium]|nr:hypothetical protein [Rhodospirillales bacterium]
MKILAFHTNHHDASAVLFDDYQMVAAVQLERLTRIKGDGARIPEEAIDEALKAAGWVRRDIDVLLLSYTGFPGKYYSHFAPWKKVEYALTGKIKGMTEELIKRQSTDPLAIFKTKKFLSDYGFRADTQVGFYRHHYAHALSALAYTNWEDALLYTADGCGDNIFYSHYIYKDNELTELFGSEKDMLAPQRAHSMGLAYGYTTQAIGFRINRHEGKLTGLAAFGQPVLADEIGAHFTVNENGLIESDFASNKHMKTYIQDTVARYIAGQPDEMKAKADVAASIQEVLEDKIFKSVDLLVKKYGVKHLGLAGGVFANVRLNRLLCEQTGIKEIFIFPGMGDEGIPVGGVHQYLIERDGLETWQKKRRRLTNVYLGCDYNSKIADVFDACADVVLISNDPVNYTADALAKGWVGALHTGRMEFGPRALGARTILASPVDNTINTTINDRLQRTEFMPFAPYVLAEDAENVFDITDANRYAAHFMTITCDVKAKWKEKIPAVVHVDGTARPQIIEREDNPLYADILSAFKAKTGLPVLINTSFNAHEEPIINTPQESLRALLDDRIDFIVCPNGVYATAEKAGQMPKAA